MHDSPFFEKGSHRKLNPLELQPRSQGLSSLPTLSLRKDFVFSQRRWRQRRETLGTRLLELKRSEEPLKKKEYLKALTEMERNKTPDSDGFNTSRVSQSFLARHI